MIVNHKYKFVFIHIGKTAGDAITHTLTPFCDNKDVIKENTSLHPNFHKHSKAKEIQQAFKDLKWDWKNYFKFAIMRNPYEILHSDYYFHKFFGIKHYSNNPPPENTQQYDWHLKCYKAINQSFEDYALEHYGHWDKSFTRIYCMNHDGIVNVNRIYQQKSLSQEFPQICKHINIPETPLIKGNTTIELIDKPRPKLQQDYTKKLIDFVEKTFAEDIALFNYNFQDAI
jgi:hypothetical protein